jgi:integrase
MATVKQRKWKKGDGAQASAWQVRYIDQAGKRRSRTFDRKRDADLFRSEVEAAVRAGTHVHDRDSITVAEAAEIWLAAVDRGRDGRPPAEEATLRQYRNHAKNHITPFLGGIRLNRLTTPRVVEFRDELLDADRSRAMVRKILGSLTGICNEAKARGYLAANPAEGVSIITTGRHKEEVEIPTKAEVRLLIDTARSWITEPPKFRYRESHRAYSHGQWDEVRRRWWYLFVRTKAATGLRLSEVRGLSWDTLDLKAETLEVAQRADEKGKIGPVKTGAGRRTISLASDLVRELREWKLQCPKGDLRLVFPNGAGKPEGSSNLWKRFWVPLCEACGLTDPVPPEEGEGGEEGRTLPRYGFHALRHFRASILIESGADVKEVQTELGHSSAKMTLDTYGHLFNDEERIQKRRARAERIDAQIFG